MFTIKRKKLPDDSFNLILINSDLNKFVHYEEGIDFHYMYQPTQHWKGQGLVWSLSFMQKE